MKTYKAIIIGATGAVGSEMVQILLSHKNCDQLTTISRKPMPQKPKLRSIVWENFSNYLLKNKSSTIDVFRDVDVVFCCLGASRNDAVKLFIHPKNIFQSFSWWISNMFLKQQCWPRMPEFLIFQGFRQ